MYSEEIILSLANRIGFGTPKEEAFPIDIVEGNSTGESGRTFNAFHALVTVENILAATDKIYGESDDEDFNKVLEDIRINAAREVLPLIMDKNQDYQPLVGYDAVIESNIVLFDDAVGYKVAMMVLEMFMASSRSNLLERNAKFAMSNLKLELEGFRNDSGALVAKGLVQKFERAVKTASYRIFPVKPTIDTQNAW